MTVKENKILEDLRNSIIALTEKMFGNGTRNGCFDQRLEHVESDLSIIKEMMPKMVTREYCSKRHEIRWSKIVLMLGLAGTWIGLALRAMGIL